MPLVPFAGGVSGGGEPRELACVWRCGGGRTTVGRARDIITANPTREQGYDNPKQQTQIHSGTGSAPHWLPLPSLWGIKERFKECHAQ